MLNARGNDGGSDNRFSFYSLAMARLRILTGSFFKVQLVLSPAAAGRELNVHREKGAPGHGLRPKTWHNDRYFA